MGKIHESTIHRALLARIREHLADLHEQVTLNAPDDHQAIAYCGCRVASDYRAVKSLLRGRD